MTASFIINQNTIKRRTLMFFFKGYLVLIERQGVQVG